MIEPKIHVRYFGLVIVLTLLFLLPITVGALENPAPSEIDPVPTITLNTTELNPVLVPVKSVGIPDSTNPDLNDSALHGQANVREKIFITDSRLVKNM